MNPKYGSQTPDTVIRPPADLTVADVEKLFCMALLRTLDLREVSKVLEAFDNLRQNAATVLSQLK